MLAVARGKPRGPKGQKTKARKIAANTSIQRPWVKAADSPNTAPQPQANERMAATRRLMKPNGRRVDMGEEAYRMKATGPACAETMSGAEEASS